MIDDIVTRLRDSAKYCGTDGNVWAERDCLEAADEIERLHRQVKMWIQIADHLAVVVAKHEPMHLALAPYDTAKDWTLDD